MTIEDDDPIVNQEPFEVSEARIKLVDSPWEGFKKMTEFRIERLVSEFIIIEIMHNQGKTFQVSIIHPETSTSYSFHVPIKNVHIIKDMLDALETSLRLRKLI
jgi:flagellar assembly factor FliW